MAEANPAVLTIAGSDSGGGAGIQADLKTFTALQCYGASVITALTAQNTLGVHGIHTCPPDFVAQQLRAVLDDIPIKAAKTGMLADAATIETIAEVLRSHPSIPVVVDPVMISTSRHRLLQNSAIDALRNRLLPLATIVTPNLDEATALLSQSSTDRPSKEHQAVSTVKEMQEAAAEISAKFKIPYVLVKGGHLKVKSLKDLESQSLAGNPRLEFSGICDPSYPRILRAAAEAGRGSDEGGNGYVVDVLYGPDLGNSSSASPRGASEYVLFVHSHIETKSTHGTGCTLSAALTCGLARGALPLTGDSVLEATREAIAFTHGAILAAASAPPIGSGNGPLNHQYQLSLRAIPGPTVDYPYPFVAAMIESNQSSWKHYVQHDFVKQLGRGVLDPKYFKHFIIQDYLYLQYYARAHGLLAFKSTAFTDISSSAIIMQHISRESSLHEAFCAEWGIDSAQLKGASVQEAAQTTAYGAYILDVGMKGDSLSLLVALAACLLGYAEVGLWLKSECERSGSGVYLEGNPYRKWMESYGGEEYQEAARAGLLVIENKLAKEPPSASKLADLSQIWKRCVELEKGFWDMAMHLSF